MNLEATKLKPLTHSLVEPSTSLKLLNDGNHRIYGMDHFGQYILNDIMKIDGADIVYE
jgi:hypothetical protein